MKESVLLWNSRSARTFDLIKKFDKDINSTHKNDMHDDAFEM